MGASGRRAGRSLRRPPVIAGEVAPREPAYLVPATGVFYALAFGTIALAVDRLLTQVEGPWLEVLGAAVVLTCVVSTWLMLRAGWRRHREKLEQRAALWSAGALVTVLLSLVAIYALIQTASFASVIAGADVHLTRPVLRSLPRPPGARLLDERPGLAGTESISQDFSIANLGAVVPFYEATLKGKGWVEDKSTAGTLLVRFSQGQFVMTVAPDQATGAGDFAVTVDRMTADLVSPSSSPAATSSP